MSREAIRRNIQEAIGAFDGGNLRNGAARLLKVLGYSSDKTFELSPNSFTGFFAEFAQYAENFNPKTPKPTTGRAPTSSFRSPTKT